MLVLLQLAFQLCQTFFRKCLLQRFPRRTSACPIVPSGEATLGIQKFIIRQIRHDLTSLKKYFVIFQKWFRFAPRISPISERVI